MCSVCSSITVQELLLVDLLASESNYLDKDSSTLHVSSILCKVHLAIIIYQRQQLMWTSHPSQLCLIIIELSLSSELLVCWPYFLILQWMRTRPKLSSLEFKSTLRKISEKVSSVMQSLTCHGKDLKVPKSKLIMWFCHP